MEALIRRPDIVTLLLRDPRAMHNPDLPTSAHCTSRSAVIAVSQNTNCVQYTSAHDRTFLLCSLEYEGLVKFHLK